MTHWETAMIKMVQEGDLLLAIYQQVDMAGEKPDDFEVRLTDLETNVIRRSITFADEQSAVYRFEDMIKAHFTRDTVVVDLRDPSPEGAYDANPLYGAF